MSRVTREGWGIGEKVGIAISEVPEGAPVRPTKRDARKERETGAHGKAETVSRPFSVIIH